MRQFAVPECDGVIYHGPKVVVVAPRPVKLATPLIFPYEVVQARLCKLLLGCLLDSYYPGSAWKMKLSARKQVTEV